MAQVQMPDLNAQRAAMKKLSFLVGDWSGSARMYRDPAHPSEFTQTEHAEFKLNGLLLMIEGIGHSSDGKPLLQALGIVSYDATGAYHMRAFNDGRWLETDMKLAEDGRGATWGFSIGEIKTHSVLRMNDKGEWTEEHEIAIGAQPPRRFMEIAVAKK